MIGPALVYAGGIAVLLGVALLFRSARRGLLVIGAGLALGAAGFLLPARETRVPVPETLLDQLMPVWQFDEVHTSRVDAPPERVYRAVKDVTAREIMLFRTLTWIRRFGRAGPESILNAPDRLPLLEVATRTGFLKLAEDPGREIVVGTVVLAPPGAARPRTPDEFRTLTGPGYALATMNFRVTGDGNGASVLTTATRVYATDAAARRRFTKYWRLIYPGSALIRRMWLRAIERRAEGPPVQGRTGSGRKSGSGNRGPAAGQRLDFVDLPRRQADPLEPPLREDVRILDSHPGVRVALHRTPHLRDEGPILGRVGQHVE